MADFLDKETMRKAATGFVAVTQVVVATMVGYFGGRYLDHLIGLQGPWCATILTAVGFVAGFYRLYLTLKQDANSK